MEMDLAVHERLLSLSDKVARAGWAAIQARNQFQWQRHYQEDQKLNMLAPKLDLDDDWTLVDDADQVMPRGKPKDSGGIIKFIKFNKLTSRLFDNLTQLSKVAGAEKPLLEGMTKLAHKVPGLKQAAIHMDASSVVMHGERTGDYSFLPLIGRGGDDHDDDGWN